MRAMGYLHGADVSDDQGAVEWDLTSGHIDAAMIQVGYATATDTIATRTGAANYRGALGAGHLVGPYFFAHPGWTDLMLGEHGAGVQGVRARDFARQAGWNQLRDLPLTLDIEINPAGLSPKVMSDWVETWLAATGVDARHLAIYTNPGFWEANTDGRQVNAHLWVAAWGAPKAPRLKGLPAPFLWQTTRRGHLPGIRGPVDLDTLLYVPDAGLPPGEGDKGTVTWTVRAGQTLQDVARQYLPRGATPAQVGAACSKIMAANHMVDTAIQEGEQIDVPQPL